MRVKIYQIDPDRDKNQVKFLGFEHLQSIQGSTDIDASLYKNVFYGDVEANDLEDVYVLFNTERIPTHQGHSLSVSDIIQVVESEDERLGGKCFFCDSVGFKTVDFDTSKCQEMDGLKCIYITPNHTPVEFNLKINEYEVLKDAVGGLIEITHPFDDDVCIVGNDEAKLIGMQGNRHVGNSKYAGPILIVGDNGGEDFVGLTDEQAQRYIETFAQPEDISREETQSDMGFSFIGFNY